MQVAGGGTCGESVRNGTKVVHVDYEIEAESHSQLL